MFASIVTVFFLFLCSPFSLMQSAKSLSTMTVLPVASLVASAYHTKVKCQAFYKTSKFFSSVSFILVTEYNHVE